MSEVSFGQKGLEPGPAKVSNWEARHRRADQESRLSENLTKIRSQRVSVDPGSAYNPDDYAPAGPGTITGAGWFFRVLGAGVVMQLAPLFYFFVLNPGLYSNLRSMALNHQLPQTIPVPGQSPFMFIFPILLTIGACFFYLLFQFAKRAKDAGFSRTIGFSVAILSLVAAVVLFFSFHPFQALFLLFGLHVIACVLPTQRIN